MSSIRNLTCKGRALITPHDDNEINQRYKDVLWVETSGTVKVEYADGSTYTYSASAVPDNTTLYDTVKKVWATGTTATGIYGCKMYD